MKKLTLVSFMCRNKKVSAFVMAQVDGKGNTVVSNSIMDALFYTFFNFIPEYGETISIGV